MSHFQIPVSTRSERSQLPKSFFASNDVLNLAKALLGKVLVSNIDKRYCSGIIVETEAYRTPDDLGCHATKHGLTERTKTMYMSGGYAYVYKCYGIHDLFNVVTGDEANAQAVLIRAIEPLEGQDVMETRRQIKGSKKLMYNGPGKFTRAMGITTAHDATNLLLSNAPLYIEDRDIKINSTDIVCGPRVGMGNIGEWKHVPWRFRIKNNAYASKPDKVVYD